MVEATMIIGHWLLQTNWCSQYLYIKVDFIGGICCWETTWCLPRPLSPLQARTSSPGRSTPPARWWWWLLRLRWYWSDAIEEGDAKWKWSPLPPRTHWTLVGLPSDGGQLINDNNDDCGLHRITLVHVMRDGIKNITFDISIFVNTACRWYKREMQWL